MKKLILALLFLLLSCPVFAETQLAWMGPVIAGSGGAVLTANHCDSYSDADVACEDGEGSTDCGDETANDSVCRNTWDSFETGGTVVFDSSHSGVLSCSDKGTKAIQITKDNTDATSVVTHIDKTASSTAYYQFYLNVLTSNANGTDVYIAGIRDGSTNQLVYLRMTGTADSNAPTLKIVYHNGASVVGGSAQSISTNTWYRIRINWVAASADPGNDGIVQFYVDNTAVTNISNNNSTRQAAEYSLGNTPGSDADTFTMQVDNIKIDDDSQPGACD